MLRISASRPAPSEVRTMKTIIGLFDTIQEANQAHKLLVHAGFGADPGSMVAPERVLQEHLFNGARPVKKMARSGALGGAALGGLLGAALVPGIGTILGIGTLVAVIVAITVGALCGAVAGGVIGALIDVGMPERDVGFYAEGVRLYD